MKKLKHENELVKEAIRAGVEYGEKRGVVEFEPTDEAALRLFSAFFNLPLRGGVAAARAEAEWLLDFVALGDPPASAILRIDELGPGLDGPVGVDLTQLLDGDRVVDHGTGMGDWIRVHHAWGSAFVRRTESAAPR